MIGAGMAVAVGGVVMRWILLRVAALVMITVIVVSGVDLRRTLTRFGQLMAVV